MPRSEAEQEMVVIRRILRAAEGLSPASLAWLRAQLAALLMKEDEHA